MADVAHCAKQPATPPKAPHPKPWQVMYRCGFVFGPDGLLARVLRGRTAKNEAGRATLEENFIALTGTAKAAQAMDQFLLDFGQMPLLEWAGVPIFLALGCWQSPYAHYIYLAMLLLVFAMLYRAKQVVLHHLTTGLDEVEFFSEDDITGVVECRSEVYSDCIKAMTGKYPGEGFMILQTLPASLESGTLCYALPGMFRAWYSQPKANERWVDSWKDFFGTYLPSVLNPPVMISIIIVVNLVLHYALFTMNVKLAAVQVEALEQADAQASWELSFEDDLNRTIEKKKVDRKVGMNLMWNEIWCRVAYAAGQAGLQLVNSAARNLRGKTFQALPEDIRTKAMIAQTVLEKEPHSLRSSSVLATGGSHQIGEAREGRQLVAQDKQVLGLMHIHVRVLWGSGARLWLNVSVFADTFHQLSSHGEVRSQMLSIAMAVIAIAQTIPNQHKGITSMDSTRKAHKTYSCSILLITVAFLVVIMLRVLGAVYWCPSHIWQLHDWSCLPIDASEPSINASINASIDTTQVF